MERIRNAMTMKAVEPLNGLLLFICMCLVIAIGASRDKANANSNPYGNEEDYDSVDQNAMNLAGSSLVLIVSIIVTLTKVFLTKGSVPQDARFTFFYMILLIEMFVFLGNSIEAHVQYTSKDTNWSDLVVRYKSVNTAAFSLNTVLLLCSIVNMFAILINILIGFIATKTIQNKA